MRFRALALCALVAVSPALAASMTPGAADLVAVIVTGWPHPALPDGLTRAEAMQWFDAAARPFVLAVEGAVRASGGTVVEVWTAAPAAHALVPRTAIPFLATHEQMRGVAEDRPGNVWIDEGEDPVTAANTGGRRMIQAEEAWAAGFRGEGTRVAILGTGIDPTHEAFRRADGSSRVVAWVDLVNGASAPYDDQGQGTFLAGSAAGSSEYDDPVHGRFQEAGVAPAADLLVPKFLDAGGSGTFANALMALNWSFANGADITVNGWGSGCTTSALSVLQMVRGLTDAGMVNVFTVGAGGPAGSSIAAPACGEAAISVGGVDGTGAIYSPSGRGPCSDIELPSGPRICPDLVAKAVGVRSAAPRAGCPLCDPSGYRTLSTISAAAAFVGGGVSLIEQMKRSYTGTGWDTRARAEETVLKQTALDLGAPGPDDAYGWGLPQVMNVHALLAQDGEARIVSSFASPPAVMRQGDSASLLFEVRNLGTGNATGTFETSLVRPDGSIDVLDTRSVTLSLFGSARFSRAFVVHSGTPPGPYAFHGSFEYAWTNATTGEVVTGSISREGIFEVRRVVIETESEGIPARAPPGAPQRFSATVRNVGNDIATHVVVRFTAPDHYVFAHADGLDPYTPSSRYAAPAPDSVTEDRNFGRVTIGFEVGQLAPGEEWSFTTTLVPTRLGAHRFLLVVTSCDGNGRCANSDGTLQQEIALAPP